MEFFSNIYPIILNNYAENELKKYLGKMEIKEIIIKTKTGYRNMMKNNQSIRIGKYAFEKSCINIYFINLYTNIGKEIRHETYKKIYENILNDCKILTVKNKMIDLIKKISIRKEYIMSE